MDNDFPTMMAGKYLPAFRREGGRFVPTQEMNNVMNLMQSAIEIMISLYSELINYFLTFFSK